jgi:hypothetical protein
MGGLPALQQLLERQENKHRKLDGGNMKENVGTADRALRSLVGPALLGAGYARLGGREGRTAGLTAMIAGALIIESAITRVCPVNAMLGIDTR